MFTDCSLDHRTGNVKPQPLLNEKPFLKHSPITFTYDSLTPVIILAAMEMLVEISNVRASLLHAHNQVQKDVKAAK